MHRGALTSRKQGILDRRGTKTAAGPMNEVTVSLTNRQNDPDSPVDKFDRAGPGKGKVFHKDRHVRELCLPNTKRPPVQPSLRLLYSQRDNLRNPAEENPLHARTSGKKEPRKSRSLRHTAISKHVTRPSEEAPCKAPNQQETRDGTTSREENKKRRTRLAEVKP